MLYTIKTHIGLFKEYNNLLKIKKDDLTPAQKIRITKLFKLLKEYLIKNHQTLILLHKMEVEKREKEEREDLEEMEKNLELLIKLIAMFKQQNNLNQKFEPILNKIKPKF